MKKTIEIPDKTIELSHGDKVEIYVRNFEILFSVFCDGTGQAFAIKKEEIRKWVK